MVRRVALMNYLAGKLRVFQAIHELRRPREPFPRGNGVWMDLHDQSAKTIFEAKVESWQQSPPSYLHEAAARHCIQ